MENPEFEVSILEKPARTLLVVRGRSATDYFAYSEEVGCEVYDQLYAHPERIGEPMGLWLPSSLQKPGTSEYVMGIELHEAHPREDADLIHLPHQEYLVFRGRPYAEELAGQAIGLLIKHATSFDASEMGFAWTSESPRYQLAPIGARGYIEGRPVRRL